MAKIFREIGYDKAKTTRQASRLLDNCKVDIAFTPYNIQCKSVIANINYTNIFKDIKSLLKENFPEDDDVVNKPIVIAHKRGRLKEQHHIILEFDTFINLVKKIKEYEDSIDDKKLLCKCKT